MTRWVRASARRRLGLRVAGGVAISAVVATIVLLQSASHAVAPGTTERISEYEPGTEPDSGTIPGDDEADDDSGHSFVFDERFGKGASVSADGRFVAFMSDELFDWRGYSTGIYVKDRVLETVSLVTVNAPDSSPGFPEAFNPVVSADGRYVAFDGEGWDFGLSVSDIDMRHVYRADRGEPNPDGSFPPACGGPEFPDSGPAGCRDPEYDLVSVDVGDGTFEIENSAVPRISDDGQTIVFTEFSSASKGHSPVDVAFRGWIWSASTGSADSIEPDLSCSSSPFSVSGGIRGRARAGTTSPPPARGTFPDVSADGRFVASVSHVDTPNGCADAVTVWDTSVSPPGHALVNAANFPVGADFESFRPMISRDGTVVAYELRPIGDLEPDDEVWVADLDGAPTLTRVVATSGSAGAMPSSGSPSISDDGRYVTYHTEDTKQVAQPGSDGDCDVLSSAVDPCTEIIVVDTGEFPTVTPEVVSITQPGHDSADNDHSYLPEISGNGRFVSWESESVTLLPPGEKSSGFVNDVFAREFTPDVVGVPAALELGGAVVSGAGVGAAASSPPKTVTFTHGGFGPLVVDSVSFGGAHPGDFEVFPADTCVGVTLHRGDSCFVSVRFTPSVPGVRSATMVVGYDGAPGRSGASASVRVSGGGEVGTGAFTAGPSPLDFGEQVAGKTSDVETVTIFNTSPGIFSTFRVDRVSFARVGNPGDFAIVRDGCSGRLVSRFSPCRISFTFTPLGVGARSAVVVVEGSAPGGPHLIGLEGDVPAPTLSVNPSVVTPGGVARVSGQNWPPGPVVVKVNTSPSREIVAFADEFGAFQVSVLVFPHSLFGNRGVVATSFVVGDFSTFEKLLITIPTVHGGNDFLYRG